MIPKDQLMPTTNLAKTQSSVRFVPRSASAILLLYPLIILWMAQFYYVLTQPDWSTELVTGLAVASAFYGVVIASVRGPSRLNFVVVYGLYLSIAHLGLVTTDLLVPGALESFQQSAGLQPGHFQSWYFDEALNMAVGLSGLGIASFFLGAGFLGSFGKRYSGTILSPESLQHSGDQSIFRLGVGLLVLCTFYMLLMMVSGVIPFWGSYRDYIQGVTQAPFYFLFLVLLSTGFTFIVATGSRVQIRRWIIWLLIPAFMLIITGKRGEIFYAGAAAIAILNRRGFDPRLRSLIVILGILLTVITSVRQYRSLELTQRDIANISINFTDAFIELGFQIRPLIITVQWIQGGEDFGYGGTYWLPIQRIITLVLPLAEREPITGNRFDVQGRTEAMGYSVIAEAYFNFAQWGVIIVLAGVGVFLSWVNRRVTTQSLALYGAITAILLNSLRNSFIFVPGQIIVVVILWQLAYLFSARIERNKLRHL